MFSRDLILVLLFSECYLLLATSAQGLRLFLFTDLNHRNHYHHIYYNIIHNTQPQEI